MSETHRVCKECCVARPITDFHMCKGKPRRVCKYCVSAKFKARYNTDADFHDRIVQRANTWCKEHTEQHNEAMARRHAERYAADVNYRKSWNKRRKARYASDAEYREKVLSLNHNKRAAMSSKGVVTADEWNDCLGRFDNACAYCGATGTLERDHVIPLSKGGSNTIDNIVPACASCNRSKGAKDMLEWYRSQSFYNSDKEKLILVASSIQIMNMEVE